MNEGLTEDKEYEMFQRSLVIAEVVFDIEGTPVKKGDEVLIIGEIQNMRDHYAFVHKGITYYGYHPEDFKQIRDDGVV